MNSSKISQRLEKQMNFIKEMDKLKSIRCNNIVRIFLGKNRFAKSYENGNYS